MALAVNELFSENTPASEARTIAERVAVKVFAAGAGTLAINAPVSFNTVTGFWTPRALTTSRPTARSSVSTA